ncbi:MAG: SRPBCC domain-containing protein [Candidatus Acidiferrales bacterium]
MIAMATAAKVEDLTLSINEEIHVKAPMGVTFDTLLEQLGSLMGGAEDRPMPMKIEPWPGGRWYRDLGDNNGHLWGHVQAIKRPTLLEIYGPLMMSYAVMSNVQYRLSEEAGGTLIKFHHLALGAIPADHREGFGKGWASIAARLKERAEKLRTGKNPAR